MASTARHPNIALAHWLRISGASHGELVRTVRAIALERGHHDIQPDRSRVPRWLQGERPRHPVPDLLAEALTRLVGSRIPLTAADLGLVGTPVLGPTSAWTCGAVVAALIDTTRSDAVSDDTTPSRARLLSGPDLLQAVQPWLHLPLEPLPEPTRAGRIGMADVQRIQDTTDAFRRLDNSHGGGLSRLAVVGQLQHVTQLAHHGRTTEEVGRALFAAIADLASVAGWMTHDTGRHAEAQEYLLLGLQAARQAGPAGTAIAGHLINCLARQANHLGRAADALDLVQTAQYGTRKLPADHRIRAVLATLEARSHAVLGHLTEVTSAARAAEEALAADNNTPVPSWVAWFDTAEYEVTIGVCELIATRHDPSRAQRAIETIQHGTLLRSEERTRSRAFDQVALARAYVAADQLEAADTATCHALELLGHVRSTRVIDRLQELDRELADIPGSAAATNARDRIRAAVTTA